MKKILILTLMAAAIFISSCGNPVNEGDIIAPVVSATTPADEATGIARNSSVTATFSEEMDEATINAETFTLKQGTTPVAGAVSYAGTVATFNPTDSLAGNADYTASISIVAADMAGNALAVAKTWDFTTAATLDTTAPTISSTTPADEAVGVAKAGNVTATFSEEMDSATIINATFTLKQGVTSIPGAVSYEGLVATFNPASDLESSSTYTAKITMGAKDLAGNALATNKVWTFTTSGSGPAPVLLRTAGDFVILAKSGIDTVPTSAVTGDIGVSPIDSTAITGFSLIMDSSNTFATSSQLTGKAYAADYISPTPTKMTTAVSDMETAYTDAAGRATPDFIELGAGEIGGLTLVPGLYKWGTDVLITTDVTLNGGPDDVWIFQVSGGITQASGKQVLLTGGALPKNIFWQAFGAVTLDTTAHMEGIILCQTAISLATGASVNGRLLSQTAVTIDSSTIVQPAP